MTVDVRFQPHTSALMLFIENQLKEFKFYESARYEEISIIEIKKDTTIMINKQLTKLIYSMIEEFREKDKFSPLNLDLILSFASFTDPNITELINKFHYINTEIASNGGIPVLKEILKIL